MYTSIKYVNKARAYLNSACAHTTYTDWMENKTIKGYDGNTIQPLSASLISRRVVWYVSMITPWRLTNLFKDLRSRVDLKPCWFRHEESRQSPSTKSTFDVQNLAIPHQLRYVNTIGGWDRENILVVGHVRKYTKAHESNKSSNSTKSLTPEWEWEQNSFSHLLTCSTLAKKKCHRLKCLRGMSVLSRLQK